MYVHILFTEGGVEGIHVVLSKVYLEYICTYTYIRIHNASIIILCKAIAHTLGFLCLFFIRVKLLCVYCLWAPILAALSHVAPTVL